MTDLAALLAAIDEAEARAAERRQMLHEIEATGEKATWRHRCAYDALAIGLDPQTELRRCAGDRKIVALLQQARDDYLHVTNRDETQGAIGALDDVVEILAENYRQEQKP